MYSFILTEIYTPLIFVNSRSVFPRSFKQNNSFRLVCYELPCCALIIALNKIESKIQDSFNQ